MSVRRLTAIMFADMAGYTALVQENEDLARRLRRRMRIVLETLISENGGDLLQYYGDGALITFPSAILAVEQGVRMQELFTREEPKVSVRIGVHSGDVVHDDEGVFGDGVNVASRVQGLGVPGAVMLSGKVYDEMKNQPNLSAQLLGAFNLKNVKRPTRIYAMTGKGLVIPAPSDLPSPHGGGASIAVLPFVNMSSDKENEFFSDGVTEELINLLTRINGLKVTARTSSFAFKGRKEDIREIGRALGVGRVLEGSVRRSGNRVRITAQLIEVETGYHLFSETYDRTLDDIFETQDEISATIVGRLEGALGASSLRPVVEQRTEVNAEAYQAYLRGRHLFHQQSPDAVRRGIQYFEKARSLDPNSGLGYLGDAMAKTWLATIGQMPPAAAYEEAESLAQSALDRQPELGEAHVVIGLSKLLYRWDPEGAFPHMQKALTLNPGASWVRWAYSIYLGIIGDLDGAEDELEMAVSLNPLDVNLGFEMGWRRLISGRVTEAMEIVDKGLELEPTSRPGLDAKGWVYLFEGNYDEAERCFKRVADLIPDPQKGITGLAIAYAVMGRVEDAKKILAILHTREKENPDVVLDLDFAMAYANIPDFDRALHYLDGALEKRMGAVLMTRYLPFWGGLPQDPRWTERWEKVGIPQVSVQVARIRPPSS